MEETSDELPNFSIGIDLLRPDPRAAAKIKPNSKNSQVVVINNSKGKIYVFTVVFKFVMHFCYRRTIRLNQENFFCNNKTNYTRRRSNFFAHKNNCWQVFSSSRNDRPLS